MRGPSLDLKQRIFERLQAAPGAVWTAVDFLDLAPRSAVDKALQRLAADNGVRRVDRGLYDRPALNTLTKSDAPPSIRAVIDAIARRDQARLLVDGMTAANDLGLTTAVPASVEVLTDAQLKPLQLGAQTVRFKRAAPSRLYWAGRPAMRVVQALYWLQDVLPSDRDNVLRKLRNVIAHHPNSGALVADLQHGLAAMPTWMQTVVRDLLRGIDEAGDHHQAQATYAPADGGDR